MTENNKGLKRNTTLSVEALPTSAFSRRPHQPKTLTENEYPLCFDYFTHAKNVGGHIDVCIAPENFKKFQGRGLDYGTLIENLQTVLDNEQKGNEEVWI
ncbi:hypothetical protein BGZ58_006644 [Dissophora ornata]|nr:hypothetical protein BGZ58_006644 [Dissophora ornata]